MDDDAFLYLVLSIILAAEGYFIGCRHPQIWPRLNVFSLIFNQGGEVPLFLILSKDVADLSWLDREENL